MKKIILFCVITVQMLHLTKVNNIAGTTYNDVINGGSTDIINSSNQNDITSLQNIIVQAWQPMQ